jgi:alanine racemase
MHSTAWAEIDRSALRHNIRCARETAPDAFIVAMIKANAYGHGLIEVAKTLAPLSDKLGVARFDEVLQLRQNGISCPLLLMGTLLNSDELYWCANNNVALAVHSLATAQLICTSTTPAPLEVWLKFDTGMNRLGFDREALLAAHTLLSKAKQSGEIRLMSHFSSADEVGSTVTQEQISRVDKLARELPPMDQSLANSAGLIAWPQSHRQWVRPGIMLYGDDPTGQQKIGLKTVMSLKSKIIAVKDVLAGDSVGYNARWSARQPSRIAAIGIGYGDGYPRQLPNGTPVLINGQQFPLVGRVSMDICSVDISSAKHPISVGDVVTLWGDDLPAMTIAAMAGTISYHLYTGVTQRVQRVHIETET